MSPVATVRTACKENQNSTDKKKYHCSKTSPHTNGIVGMRATTIFVDMVFDNL
jgi:hypothetical protein